MIHFVEVKSWSGPHNLIHLSHILAWIHHWLSCSWFSVTVIFRLTQVVFLSFFNDNYMLDVYLLTMHVQKTTLWNTIAALFLNWWYGIMISYSCKLTVSRWRISNSNTWHATSSLISFTIILISSVSFISILICFFRKTGIYCWRGWWQWLWMGNCKSSCCCWGRNSCRNMGSCMWFCMPTDITVILGNQLSFLMYHLQDLNIFETSLRRGKFDNSCRYVFY